MKVARLGLRRLRPLPMLGLSIAALVFVSCGAAAGEAERAGASGRINIVTTTGMIGDAAREVGGDRVEVTALMGPGVDPHTYKASERDVIRIAEADIIFYGGLHLEAKMADVFAKIESAIVTVAVTESMDRASLLSPPGFENTYDPHVWFDVSLWTDAVREVEETLISFDPAHEDLYRSRAERYLAELEDLHLYVKGQARRVPEARRVLITAHDAFGYFGRAYGFEVLALQGISTVAEAGAADVSGLADLISERRIPAIFVESSVPTRFIEAVQAAVRARGYEVSIGGSLFSDAMGDPGTPEGTYPGMVRHNIDTIVEALL